ncbi:hypothetical protein SAMN05216510_4095 [Pseudomonas coleopterorum]|nr:hypothetical protein SAMN05216510_4095 [Pseudomonas coleopterorum]
MGQLGSHPHEFLFKSALDRHNVHFLKKRFHALSYHSFKKRFLGRVATVQGRLADMGSLCNLVKSGAAKSLFQKEGSGCFMYPAFDITCLICAGTTWFRPRQRGVFEAILFQANNPSIKLRA